uniref:Uncharacterized protein n=1 Tax=Pantoea phage Survivor TaxID=3232176 RepID=A0AAU8KZQ3_9CAUD
MCLRALTTLLNCVKQWTQPKLLTTLLNEVNMKGVSRRSLLLFVVGKSFTPKAVVQDVIISTVTKAVVGPELEFLASLRKRFNYAK